MSAIEAKTDRRPLRSLLRSWRTRVHPEARSLGIVPRAEARIGKVVTQEEIAGVVGISARWYAAFESGIALRTSPVVLGRIAEALMLADDERRQLFTLAIPEIIGASLRFPLTPTFTIASLKTVVRRLCAATTEDAAMTVLAEGVAEHFPHADFVGVFRRSAPGLWEFPVIVGDPRSYAPLPGIQLELNDGLNPLQIDEAMLHGVLLQPGDVGTRRELHRDLTVKPRIDRVFSASGFVDANFLAAHIRSNRGLTANLFVNCVHQPNTFAEYDRMLLAALAELASVALSDAPEGTSRPPA
ncbi:MAG TPA: helix-turn-helix transcriptional regulator [Candidatus Elarobacter sp.]|nr:helix-turn-helix transcriptional regulator [Candidatus Elarobacter sp.]HEV2737015.1 helix-turn-helix transcriptional regulator [Candidatus Elarobacter sp.]